MNKRVFAACAKGLAALCAAGCQSVVVALPPMPLAFPGAEGAGAMAIGGRGGAVLKVTTLADDGPGSLRAAIEQPGPRTILFDVDGTIVLQSPLRIREGNVTIAGQSAPGDGIALRDHPVIVDADHVVIRYIRVRMGDEARVEGDALSVVGGTDIILDHVSASWSTDETLSVTTGSDPSDPKTDRVTVQWSIISESLNESVHAKGAHGYGSLVRGHSGARYSFHHNLWAHHRARMPRPGNYRPVDDDPEGLLADFTNNVFYNWGGSYSGYNADTASRSRYNFVNNAYLPGPDSRGQIIFDEDSPFAQGYFSGNAMAGDVPADQATLLRGEIGGDYLLAAPLDVGPIAVMPTGDVLAVVLAEAGASHRRDPVDARIVQSVRDRTGGLIDDEAEVGGWPVLETGSPRRDTDGDGLPDAWERDAGLDPADPLDGAQVDPASRYTWLEVWLASLTDGR